LDSKLRLPVAVGGGRAARGARLDATLEDPFVAGSLTFSQ
jgi:hypothetical protein